jgi:hypothetical protein
MPTTLFIILAIVWIIIPIIAKKKQQQAKAEAERQRAARQRAQQPVMQQPVRQPMRTTPLAPSVRPAQSTFQPTEGLGSQEGKAGAVLQGERAHDVTVNLSQVKTTLKEAKTSITHTVTASSDSGHAHEETSMTGIEKECAPEDVRAGQAVQAAQAAALIPGGDSAFAWDVNQARSGLVMAEILGPCLALRD